MAEANWRYDSQDSPVVPSHGTFANTNLRHAFDGPDITPPLPTGRSSVGLTQLAGEATVFKSLSARGRLFFLGGGGTSFGDHPLPTDQFPIGSPFHLGALDYGEIRGDHYYVATGGTCTSSDGCLTSWVDRSSPAHGWRTATRSTAATPRCGPT